MPLSNSTSTREDSLNAVLDRITDLWKFVGFTSVNDQPVKNPTDDEMAQLADLLAKGAEMAKRA